jgi:hypothetical protein
MNRKAVIAWIKEDKMESFYAELILELQKISADSVDIVCGKLNKGKFYNKSRAWVIGGVRHGLAQQAFMRLALKYGYLIDEEASRVVVSTGHFLLQLCKLISKPSLARRSTGRTETANNLNQLKLWEDVALREDGVTQLLFGIIGFGYSYSKKTIEERLSKTRFVQLGIPDAEYKKYVFPAIDIEGLLAEFEAMPLAVEPESVKSRKEFVKQSIKRKQERKTG